MEIGYCGCCGRELPEGRSARLWCTDCTRHVLPAWDHGAYRHIWERTYCAQTGEDCPYQTRSKNPR